MPGARPPSGPGTLLKQQRAAVTQREELDEMSRPRNEAESEADSEAADAASGSTAARAARHAERDAQAPTLPSGRGGGRSGGAQRGAEPGVEPAARGAVTHPHWVLVADDAVARVMQRPASGANLEEVRTFTDPLAHAREADLHRDAHGRRSGDDPRMGGNATNSAGDSQEHLQADRFAHEVAAWLGEAEHAGRFAELTLVAAPRFLGQLRKALSPQVMQRVVAEHAKDVIHESMEALTQRLFKPRVQKA